MTRATPAPSHPDLIAGGDALVRCLVLTLDAKAFELLPELVGAFGVGLALWSAAAAHHLLDVPVLAGDGTREH
jgi:hypothetical protein